MHKVPIIQHICPLSVFYSPFIIPSSTYFHFSITQLFKVMHKIIQHICPLLSYILSPIYHSILHIFSFFKTLFRIPFTFIFPLFTFKFLCHLSLDTFNAEDCKNGERKKTIKWLHRLEYLKIGKGGKYPSTFFQIFFSFLEKGIFTSQNHLRLLSNHTSTMYISFHKLISQINLSLLYYHLLEIQNFWFLKSISPCYITISRNPEFNSFFLLRKKETKIRIKEKFGKFTFAIHFFLRE